MNVHAILFCFLLSPVVAIAQWDDYQDNNAETLIDDTKQPRNVDSENPGFRIDTIEKGSVYEKLGLKKGDIITSWNGHKIATAEDAEFIWKDLKESKKFNVVVERNGKKQILHYSIK